MYNTIQYSTVRPGVIPIQTRDQSQNKLGKHVFSIYCGYQSCQTTTTLTTCIYILRLCCLGCASIILAAQWIPPIASCLLGETLDSNQPCLRGPYFVHAGQITDSTRPLRHSSIQGWTRMALNEDLLPLAGRILTGRAFLCLGMMFSFSGASVGEIMIHRYTTSSSTTIL